MANSPKKAKVCEFIRGIFQSVHGWKEDSWGNLVAPNKKYRFHFGKQKWHYQHKTDHAGWVSVSSGFFGMFEQEEFTNYVLRRVQDGRKGND